MHAAKAKGAVTGPLFLEKMHAAAVIPIIAINASIVPVMLPPVLVG
jgi:NAD kinase